MKRNFFDPFFLKNKSITPPALDCGPNEEYDECLRQGLPTGLYPNTDSCGKKCIIGCRCKLGFLRNSDWQCVAPSDCNPKLCLAQPMLPDSKINKVECNGRFKNSKPLIDITTKSTMTLKSIPNESTTTRSLDLAAVSTTVVCCVLRAILIQLDRVGVGIEFHGKERALKSSVMQPTFLDQVHPKKREPNRLCKFNLFVRDQSKLNYKNFTEENYDIQIPYELCISYRIIVNIDECIIELKANSLLLRKLDEKFNFWDLGYRLFYYNAIYRVAYAAVVLRVSKFLIEFN
uniref:TIL domain-containing protein n=1 Tax=Glossina austeni TaxID=7395 RepID=A0A1A9UN79_GLOAU